MIIVHLFWVNELQKIIIDSNHISPQAYEISSNLVRPGGGIQAYVLPLKRLIFHFQTSEEMLVRYPRIGHIRILNPEAPLPPAPCLGGGGSGLKKHNYIYKFMLDIVSFIFRPGRICWYAIPAFASPPICSLPFQGCAFTSPVYI